jgi:hypothetical protein
MKTDKKVFPYVASVDVKLPQDILEVSSWCKRQFGEHFDNDLNGVWGTSWYPEKGGTVFSFLNERDYIWFKLRWP